jgi:DNA primase
MPFIDRDFINDLSQRVDIVDLINRRVPLKKAGKDYKACCPFHNEKTPSFTVVPNKQIYHCFGCAENGGAIDFVMKFDHLNFQEAVETVASESGISVIYDKKAKPINPKIKRYIELMKNVSEYYQDQLKRSPAKNKVVGYAKQRGISGQTAKRFELGFAPPGWSNLFDHFKSNLDDVRDLEIMGLLVKKNDKNDDYYDRFRDRIVFPIHNSKGDVIAFGGRVLSDQDKPKYLNSPETPIFSKSNELYGLHHCRKYSRSIDYILVVEGYMDVVALHQGGIFRTVATLGTATTAQHLNILSRTSNVVIFCFDGDRAGRAAAWKALNIALPVIKPGMVVKFLFLPDNEDPDSLINKESVKSFEERIEGAHTLSKFLFDHVISEVDFDTIEGKTIFLEKVAVLINTVSYGIYQQQLIEGVAKVVGQSIEQVRTVFAKQKESVQKQSFEKQDYIDEISDQHLTDFIDNDVPLSKPTNKTATKALMSKMISLLLNYPILADDTVEIRIRNIEQSEVLLELVHSAQIDENISQQKLIKPFQNKISIYNRLKVLCSLEPSLSESQARDEFLDCINKIEKQQKNFLRKKSIRSANTAEEERKIMMDIQKGKAER